MMNECMLKAGKVGSQKNYHKRIICDEINSMKIWAHSINNLINNFSHICLCACVSGGPRAGVSDVSAQFLGPRCYPALRDSGGASAAVCHPHHVLSVEYPSSCAQIHPESREHSGAVHAYFPRST